MASAQAFLTELAGNHLQETIRKTVGKSKIIKTTLHIIPKGAYPFVVDMKL